MYSRAQAKEENKYSVADILSSMGNSQPPDNTVTYSPKFSFGGSAVTTSASSTLTPTTLNNLEQTFNQLQNNSEPQFQGAQYPDNQYQSGFVPPPVSSSRDSYSSSDQEWGGSAGGQPMKKLKTNSRTAVLTEADIYTPGYLSTSRKPPQRKKDEKIAPEELHRRLVRRERNKIAAAKCRQRRVDHTNILIAETDKLDGERNELENEIQSLQQQKEHLEFLLQAHRPLCKLQHTDHMTLTEANDEVKVKVEPIEGGVYHDELIDERSVPYNVNCYKPRPTSLPLKPAQLGVPITTPSSGIFTFGLDSIVDGHTGLTPLTGIPSSVASDVKDLSSPTLMVL